MNAISTFRDRSRHVILRRLGFYGYCDSLKLIGTDLSVTRERIRQIEVVCLRTINKNCGTALNDKLKKCLANRKTTLYIDLLEVEDQWFYGFSDKPVFFTRTIEKLSKYHVFKIKERPVITQIHAEQWNNLQSETLAYFKSQITEKLSQKEVKQQVRRIASEKGAADLTDSLQEFLKDQLHFAAPKGKGAKELCSVGRGLSNILEAQLLETTKPLHYIELAQKCSAQVGRHVEGYVHNSLKDLAYIYGRGIYGTLQHFPLDNKNKKKILVATENIIRQGPATRQWTCSELLSILKERKSDLPDKLDKYILNIILTDSNILKSVGRLVWILKSKTGQCKVPRVDLQKAVLTIIEQAGKPLLIHEIKKLIMKKRGLDEYFTILPTAKIARTKPNTWGLVNRDFLVTKAEQDDILDSIYHKLKKHQEGLHITELKKSLFEAGIILHPDFTDYMALSLCQADHRLKVYRGQIVGLSTWRNGKRVTIRAAIEHIAQNVNFPMTMSELRHSIEEIVKHDVKQPLHRILENANFVRDEDSNTWYVR
jgi:hypothetical protein